MLVLAALGSCLCLSASMQEPDDAAIRKLVEQLGADFLEERESARKALEKVGQKGEGRLIDGLASPDHRIRRNCIELLTAFKSRKAMDRAAELFRSDEDGSVREAGFKLLQALGKEAEDHLIAALESPGAEHRKGAIQALAEFKSEKCADKMAALHEREQDKDVKAAAFQCLQSLGYQPFLLKCLASPDPAIRRDAFNGLKKAQGDEVLAAVGLLFSKEGDVAVIEQAFNYLRDAKDKAEEKVEPHFLAGLKNASEPGRRKALEGLKSLKRPRSEQTIDAVADVMQNDAADKVREDAAEFLMAQGLKAEAPLVKALSSTNVKVRLSALQALGGIKSERPLAQIAQLFREDKDRQVHRKAFDYLEKMGIRAEKELLLAVDDEDKEIKRLAVLALGNAKSEAAIDRLMDVLVWTDSVMKSAAMDALVRIGPKAVEKVNAAVAAGKLNPRAADGILVLFYQEEVERILDSLVTDTGGSGFYEGQFRELEKFGKEKAIRVLLRIVSEPGYAFRLAERREKVPSYEPKMRDLAIMALGDFGDPRAIDALKEGLKEAGPAGAEGTTEELMVALFRLGEKKPLDDYLKKAEADVATALKGETKDDGCSLLFSIGLVLNRVGRRDEAQAAYLRLVAAVEEHKLEQSARDVLPAGLYNLACLASMKGDKAKGVEWLEKAVRAGFKDRQWIKLDRDLESIRNESGYLKLLSEDKLFETKKDE
jgi:HEAT repeat protein